MVKRISSLVNREVAAVCSDSYCSVWRSQSVEAFDHAAIIQELHSRAPTLFTLLKACLKTKTPRENEDLILTVIAGIIFKHRRPSCSLVQRVISLILYAGHSAKQVHILHSYHKASYQQVHAFTNLQCLLKMWLCLSLLFPCRSINASRRLVCPCPIFLPSS